MGSENMLAAYKKMKKNGGQKYNPQQENRLNGNRSNNADSIITGSVEFLNEQAFGKYVPSEDENSNQRWTAESELQRLEKGFTNEQIEKSGLPDNLKRSFMENPSIDVSSAKNVMDEMENRMNEMTGGFEASRNIMERLDKNDRKNPLERSYVQPIERPVALNENGSVDYDAIRQIVDETVAKRLSSFRKNLVNEGVGSVEGGRVITMKEGENGFLFLDSSDNVYECKLIYKGKRKKKK